MANPSVTASLPPGSSLTIPGELPPCLARAVKRLLGETEVIRLDELAAYAGISKFHLSRLFVRYLGHPPLRFHSELRLARAKQLLRSGRRGADVAYALGFADQAHLSRRFKVRWGVSPRTYARMLEA